MRKPAVAVFVLIGFALTGAAPLVGPKAGVTDVSLPPPYELAPVSRGESVAKVLAAGTVQPSTSVVVGSQVSGQVKEVLVDHNDPVATGQPIARIDAQLFASRLEQARGDVAVADHALRIARAATAASVGAVAQAEAEQAKARAEARRAEAVAANTRRRLERKSALMQSGSSSASEAEDAQAAREVADAEANAAAAVVAARAEQVRQAQGDLAVAWARIGHAEAQLHRNEAALGQAEADLERTVIRAPANGIVVERSVSAGQTVAASFQAPSLFTIGDLSSVAVEVAIDEADIGRIQSGQEASFTVDAYPDATFLGRITQVRRAPHTQETVVTYTVILAAGNPNLLLFPGMTAKAEIITGRSPDALQVPTAALRYRPRELATPAGSHVWVIDGHAIHPVPVRIGASDGGMAEVAGDLVEGQAVVIGDASSAAAPAAGWRRIGAMVSGWTAPVRTAIAGLPRR